VCTITSASSEGLTKSKDQEPDIAYKQQQYEATTGITLISGRWTYTGLRSLKRHLVSYKIIKMIVIR